ncbi:pupariation [Nesidiocoris tenuis]|uniref:Pupariation n=1 Tax=Nesidiocoris tenuis TaxID=355587 RepID=A0ABN7B4P3_9HEMI|nr:pupariation [Nesidiocoris tenuis]
MMNMLFMLAAVCASILTFGRCSQNTIEPSCFFVEKNKPSSLCACSRLPNRTDTVVCCNINSLFIFHQGLACGDVEKFPTKHLYMYNYTIDKFDAGSSKWRNLETLSVTNGKFKRVVGQFSGSLNRVNFSGNSLTSIDESSFAKLPRLRLLDISHNNLTSLPDLPALEQRNVSLDISGNHYLECKNMLHLISLETFNNLHIANINETFCLAPRKSFHWFNSTDKVSWDQLIKRRSVEEKCPKGPNYQCNCSFYGMDLVQGQSPSYSIQVDCSGRHLTELPKQLPLNTIVLNVSNNNISSLQKLINDSSYSNIRDFIADNNNIESIKSLEGSHFIYTFRILSLKENRLKSIPIYLFSHVFDSRWDAKHVNLAGNRLNCDCSTAQSVKLWLMTNTAYIRDYSEILCDKGLGRVIDLDMTQVCIYQKDWTEYIYYIIAGEILLLILLVSKVSYDYCVFKTTGYLPWPASKMPKLPCDWVFES